MSKRSLFNQVILALSLLCAGGLLVRYVLVPFRPSVFTDGVSILDEGTWRASRRVVWEPPAVLESLSSADFEGDPCVGPGGRLYYVVGMPGGLADLWVAERTEEGLVIDARPLAALNTPHDERDPFVTEEGIYFASNRPGGDGGLDVYFARREAAGFGTPVRLGPGVNSIGDDRSPSIDAAGRLLAFASDRTHDERSGGFDLYLAERIADGEIREDSFSDPLPVTELNTDADELDPFVWHDGTRLVFASNREGGAGGLDLWWSLFTGEGWLEARPIEALNSPEDDFGAHATDRGFSLYYASNRPVGPGLADLFHASSRELFPLPGERSILDLFAEGLIVLLLILALAAFLANRWTKLDIVVKCILISILLHLLLLLWFRSVELQGVLEEPAANDAYRIRFVPTPEDTAPAPQANRERGDELESLARVESAAAAADRLEVEVPQEPTEAAAVRPLLAARPDATRSPDRPSRGRVAPASEPERAEERPLPVADLEPSDAADPARADRDASRVAMARDDRRPPPERRVEPPAVDAPGRARSAPVELASDRAVLERTTQRPSPEALVARSRPRRTDPVDPVAVSERGPRLDESDPNRNVAATDDVAVSRSERAAPPPPHREPPSRLAPPETDPQPRAVGVQSAAPESLLAAASARAPAPRIRRPSGRRPAPVSERLAVPPAEPRVATAEAPASEPHAPAALALERRASASPAPKRWQLDDPPVRAPRAAADLTIARSRALDLERPTRRQAPLRRRDRTRAPEPRTEPELAPDPLPAAPVPIARNEPTTPSPRTRPVELRKRDTFRAERGADFGLLAVSRARPVGPALEGYVAARWRGRDVRPAFAGIYSRRTESGKALALEQYGGTLESERAVQRGLAYLARTQNRDGSWGRPVRDNKYGRVQVGKTGLALLAFLASGHTQFSETNYTANVGLALEFLLSTQHRGTGHFGITSSYSHGIATYAIAEAYAMTSDPSLRPSLERAVTWILMNQYRETSDPQWFGGWGYYYPDRRRVADEWPRASVAAWQVMALESARIGGLEVPEVHLDAAKIYLLNSFDSRLGQFRYSHDPSRLRSKWPALPASTPASIFALLLLDHDADDPRIHRGLRYVHERAPQDYRRGSDDQFVLEAVGNLYFWYYGTLAMFLRGGDDWDRWNENLRDLLVEAQNEDGSWTPVSHYARYADDRGGDRGYTTALCVLMLEVYYRYFTPLLQPGPKRR